MIAATTLGAFAVLLAAPYIGFSRPTSGAPSRRSRLRSSIALALAAAASTAAVLGWANRHSQVNTGEPFAWFNGVSAWPSMLLWLVSMLLGAALLVRSWVVLHDKELALAQELSLEPMSQAGHWQLLKRIVLAENYCSSADAAGTTSDRKTVAVDRLWSDYRRLGHFGWRLGRAVLILAGVVTAVAIISGVVGRPGVWPVPPPVRGDDQWLATFVRFGAYGVLGLLTCFVVDAVQLTIFLIRPIALGEGQWRTRNEGELDSTWRERMDVYFIAQHTEAVCSLVFYPFLLTVPILLANNRYFDHWDWPIFFVLLLAAYGVLIVSRAIQLRSAAEQCRTGSLRELHAQLLKESAANPSAGRTAKVELLWLAIRNVEHESAGALVPWTRQPVLKAFLIPFGGVSLVAFVELLLTRGLPSL